MSSDAQGRKRSRQACQTCRDLKRRCDGADPCATCVRFEYECRYTASKPRKEPRLSTNGSGPVVASHLPHTHHASPDGAAPEDSRARTVEANSGPAFFRSLSKRLDPKRSTNPRKNSFAWNAFLGCRQADFRGTPRDIAELITQPQMQHLANIYLDKLDRTYGFLDHAELAHLIRTRWTPAGRAAAEPLHDAILCGVAAIGYVFSVVQPSQVESDLVESARVLLSGAAAAEPTATSVSALLLRVVYLRIAGTHYAAWSASSSTMHMIDAAGLHLEEDQTALMPPVDDVGVERRRRIVSVAQHLNIWMSFDMGLSCVALPSLPMTAPAAREGDATRQLMELLPFTMELSPARKPSVADLETALFAVLDRVHTLPSSSLAQCNLTLCLCRRLRSMEVPISDPVLQQVLIVTSQGIQAAQDLLLAKAPWHHMGYVPFQIVCVLLAIDTVSSIAQLRAAMQCLKDISVAYDTPATQEALKTARSLVLLHQRGKEVFASALSDILKAIPADDDVVPDRQQAVPQMVLDGLGSLEQDLASSWNFDLDQFLGSDFFWNAGVNGI